MFHLHNITHSLNWLLPNLNSPPACTAIGLCVGSMPGPFALDPLFKPFCLGTAFSLLAQSPILNYIFISVEPLFPLHSSLF